MHVFINYCVADRLRSGSSSSSSISSNPSINSSPVVYMDIIEEFKITDHDSSSGGGLSTLKRDLQAKHHHAPSVISCRPVFYPSPSGMLLLTLTLPHCFATTQLSHRCTIICYDCTCWLFCIFYAFIQASFVPFGGPNRCTMW